MTHTSAPLGRTWTFATAVVVTTLLAACSFGRNAEREPTMDTKEAASRIEGHIKETIAQLPDTARLRERHKDDALPCGLSDDEGSDRIIVEHDYQIEGLSSQEHQEHFELVKRYWENRGHHKTRIDQTGDRYWTMVYTDSENFNLKLSANLVDGKLFIRSQSPCIRPER